MPPVDIGILTTDVDLVVRSWDAWLERVTGLSADAVCGRPLADVAPGAAGGLLAARFHQTLTSGAVHVLSPGLHGFLVPCPPQNPSRYFQHMQQRVHIGPLLDGERLAGVMVTITDVTQRIEAERALAEDLASGDPERRRDASQRLAASRVESLDPFVPVLGADDWKVRQATVQGLARAADDEFLRNVVDTLRRNHRNFNALSSALKLLALSELPITGPLAQLLKDSDADLRIQAALALGEQQDPNAAPPLIDALGDPDVNVRFHAIEALGRLHAVEAVEPLAAMAEQGDFFLAFAAIEALSNINDPAVAPRITPLLADPNLRDAVTTALGALGDDQAVPPLVAALNDHESGAPGVAAALVAIERRQERQFAQGGRIASLVRDTLTVVGERHLIASLRTADPSALASLVRVLGWLRREAAAPELVTLLGRDDVRDEVIEALVRQGEPIVQPLVAQLQADDAAVRAAAITTLGRLGSTRATPALIALLDEDRDTMIAAAGALARIGDPAAFDALLRLVSHEDAAVRQAVIGALNSIGHPDMPARVAALLDAPDARTRESAVRIAGYFGYSETADAIVARTDDPVESVRIAAIEHLPFLEDPRTTGLLAQALRHTSPSIRAAVAKALGRLTEDNVSELLAEALDDVDPWVRYYAVRSAAERGHAQAMPRLLKIAREDDAAHVRIAALDALGVTGDQHAIDTLVHFAADANDDIACAALTALGHVGGEQALPHLIEAIRSSAETRRRAALQGLALIRSEPAVDALQWLASAEDPHTAHLAMEALGKIACASGRGGDAAVRALIEFQGEASRAEHAAFLLCRLPESRVDIVGEGLRHPQPSVRQRTVALLARFGPADAAQRIAPALGDAAPAVREAAVVVLARLGARGLEQQVADLARTDPAKNVRRAAAAAAARMRSPGQA